MIVAKIVNRRSGLATNSSSTHSVIYRNKGEVFEDLNIFDERYYDRCTPTIAASREAKIRYIFGNCYYVTELVELLQERYPEIKQYYPMVKEYYDKYNSDELSWSERDEFNFGDHCRGELFNREDIYTSYLGLCNIIDNPELVIIGGSDELDFVYDTIEGHDEYQISNFRYIENIVEKYKNGNYYVVYGKKWGKTDKARLVVEDGTMCPEVPELVDMKITNACEYGCRFCYMGSTKDGKHADLKTIEGIVNNFRQKTEFAIGGGNVLLHPQFPQVVEYIKRKTYNHIVNITIKHNDIFTINEKDVLKKAIIDYVDGIGISVQKPSDIKKVEEFAKEMIIEHGKHVSIHLIPELLGMYTTKEILEEMVKMNKRIHGCGENDEHCNRWNIKNYNPMRALFLGFKRTGRGESINKIHKFTKEELQELIKASDWSYCIDTSFVNTYQEFYDDWYGGDEEYFLTRNEGEYSMYIDAVTGMGYKSSYDTAKGYPIPLSNAWDSSIKVIPDVFGKIREDNGFAVYKPKRKYYE